MSLSRFAPRSSPSSSARPSASPNCVCLHWHDPAVLLRTQDLPPLYIENSCFFIFTPELLRDKGTRIGARPLMVEMASLEAVDIDIEEDFALAAAIAERSEIST